MSARKSRNRTPPPTESAPRGSVHSATRRALQPDHLALLRNTHFLIAHHQQIIEQLNAQAQRLLLVAYNVDISTNEWLIDLEGGVVRRKDAEDTL